MGACKKIIFLAIDAGDKVLIRKWAKDGTLPNMRALMSRGLVGETLSVEGVYEGATWPSFYTGVNPGRHGFHRLSQIDPGTYWFTRCTPGEFITHEPFWVPLNKSGKSIAVLDIPLSAIMPGLNGMQTIEWGSHDGVYGFRAWPEKLKKDITKRFGEHPWNKTCDWSHRSPEEFSAFRDQLIEGIEKKCALTRHYLKEKKWDYFAQVFTESQCIGHQCWHLHDPAHPNHDPKVTAHTGDPVREVYKAIDKAIGEILKDVDEDTHVFLLASHRMAHNIGANFMLEEILEKLGYLKKCPESPSPKKESMSGKVYHAAKTQWQKTPAPLRVVLKQILSPVYHAMKNRTADEAVRQISSGIDLARSKCFPHPNGNLVSGIRVNQAGREPRGLIKKGNEFNALFKELSADLLSIVEVNSGKPMIKKVYKAADLFQGERMDHLPDILAEWNDEIVIGSKGVNDDPSCRVRMASDKMGLLEGEYTYCRTGDHRREGLFVAAGPGIEQRKMERIVSIMDFAPTFLNLLGVETNGLDGKPIHEVIDRAR